MRRLISCVPFLLAMSCICETALAAPPIRALVITGHNNHNWRYTSQMFKDTLEATGQFAVEVTDSPNVLLADVDALGQYGVFILDYNDFADAKRWGDAAEPNFLNAVRNGTGVVAVHSANNAFKGWDEYEKMLGLVWRDQAGHGKFHQFNVTFTDREHPITKGLSDFSDHLDELYHGLENVRGVPCQVLAVAHSSEDSGGTGKDEPMALVLQYGKGRVFATPLGHVWTNQPQTKASIASEDFKTLICRAAEWAATGAVTLGTKWNDVIDHNQLTQAEQIEGWLLLFDGKSTQHFRGFRNDEFPREGWIVKNGTLQTVAGVVGGDIVTIDQFADFEFVCQWKVAHGANSGIMYRCTENQAATWHTGPEMQILDDAANPQANGRNRAGALYDLVACSHDVVRPTGEWNHVRIVAKGSKLEHWLNGCKVVECDLESDAYKQLREASKFASMPDFSQARRGHIALQGYGSEVWFRGMKVRRLD